MDWLNNAACRSISTREFFENFEEKDMAGRMKTLAICASCPSRAECQEYAESFSHTYGVWAGYFYRDGIRRDALKIKRSSPTHSDNNHLINI